MGFSPEPPRAEMVMEEGVSPGTSSTSASPRLDLATDAGAEATRHPPPLTSVAQTFVLLGLEGVSTGLAFWTLRASHRMVDYVTKNELHTSGRNAALKSMLLGALMALALGAALILVSRPRSIEMARRLAFRCAPLCLAALVPLLFNWRLWVNNDLTFLVLASIFILSVKALVQVSLETEPLLPHRFAVRQRARVRAVAARVLGLRWLPLVLVVSAAIGYAVYFSIHTINTHYRIETSSYDLGLENNLLWNLIHGAPLFRATPFHAATHAGHHMTFFAFVLAGVYAFAPACETLLVIQAMLLGAAAIPLYFLAKRTLGAWVGFLFGVAYLFYAPLHGSNLYDFHYVPLGVLFLWLTLYLLEARRDRWVIPVVLLTLSIREDMGAMLAVIGAYLVIKGERPRAGLILAVVSACYFITLKFFIMPHFLEGRSAFVYMYEGLLPKGETGYGGVLKTAFANPAFALHTVLEKEKLIYILQILAPLAFLSVRRPSSLLLLLPGCFFALLSTNYEALRKISFQYTAYWTPFVFIGAIAGLKWIEQRQAAGRLPAATRTAWLIVLPMAVLINSHQHGAILQHNTARAQFVAYRFGINAEDRKRHDDLYALIAQVPPTARIVSAECVVPHVSSRRDSYSLRNGVADAEYMIFALAARTDEVTEIIPALQSGAFGVVEERGEFVLAKRGHPTDRNKALVKRLERQR